MQKLEIFQLRLSKVRYSTCYIFYDNWNTDSLFCWQCIQRDISYNPRARMGRDQICCIILLKLKLFQFTRPHGARHIGDGLSDKITLFQFTRPHGARLQTHGLYRHPMGFNSRARMGRDFVISPDIISSSMFQFTRPHGARQE